MQTGTGRGGIFKMPPHVEWFNSTKPRGAVSCAGLRNVTLRQWGGPLGSLPPDTASPGPAPQRALSGRAGLKALCGSGCWHRQAFSQSQSRNSPLKGKQRGCWARVSRAVVPGNSPWRGTARLLAGAPGSCSSLGGGMGTLHSRLKSGCPFPIFSQDSRGCPQFSRRRQK